MPLTLDRQNAYRARYAQMRPGWRPATVVYEAMICETVSQFVVADGNPTLLDLGCGRGGVLEQIADLPVRPIGLDPDRVSLAEHRLPTLWRAAAAAGAIPLPPESVDVVISAWVLEHLPDPERAFCEVGRVLKPGGVFIALAPNKHSPIAWLNRFLKPLQNTLVPRLYGRVEADTFPVVYQANTRRQLNELARTGGMKLEAFHNIDDPTYLAFNGLLFRLNVWLTRLLPARMAVHFVSLCRRED